MPNGNLWSKSPLWLPGAVLLAVWLLAIRQLDLEWTINPQYQYGWIVPLLTVLLWWRAWLRRPAPGLPVATAVLPGLVFLVALLAFPLRVIQEANPDWRLLNYYFAAQAILVTALLVDNAGGLAWLRHFAFPLLFPLVSVPWPSGPEHALIEGLQQCIAGLGVEGASWMGWVAFQRGNLIVLSHGIVGVNEACSGIRSLQSSLMIALFLGDYFQLAVLRRGVLVILAITFAFGLNAVRAFFLIVMMDLHGPEALAKFHDPAGFTIAFACLLLLWITSTLLEGRKTAPDVPIPARIRTLRSPGRWIAVLLLAWGAAEIANQGWYLWHERTSLSAPIWTLRWPPPRPGFANEEIDDVTRSYLRYDEGHHGKWHDQFQWEVFFFTWNPGRVTAGLAQAHRPDICFPASGFTLQKDLGVERMTSNGVVLPMNRYIFQDPITGRLYYVFQAVTDDRIWNDGEAAYDYTNVPYLNVPYRLRAAWAGRRNPGQRSILIINQGAAGIDEAEAGVRNLLNDSVTLSP